MTEPIIKTINLEKSFFLGKSQVLALREVDLAINPGEFVVFYGPSGSGKTTLLSLLAGLDKPTGGEVIIRNHNIYEMSEPELARYRRTKIGMVFQQFNLVSTLNARDNVALPLVLSGIKRSEANKRAAQVLKIVGLSDRIKHKPIEMSGGEQQRVAIARAMVANPWIMLVDEPTGNLDTEAGREVMEILNKLNSWGRTILLVTHNPEFLKMGDRVLHMADGKIVREEKHSRAEDKAELEEMKYYITPKRNPGLGFIETLRLSKVHFLSKRIRTFLTTLGVALGVGSIITLVSLGVGLQQITKEQLASFEALHKINVATDESAQNKLDDSLVSRLTNLDNVSLVSPIVTLPTKITLANSTSDLTLSAIKPEALNFEGINIAEGSAFLENQSIILSKAAAKNFIGGLDKLTASQGLVGQKVKLNLVIIPSGELTLSDLTKAKNVEVEAKISGITNDEVVSAAYMKLSYIKEISAVTDYTSINVRVADRKKLAETRTAIEKMGFSTTSVVNLIEQIDRVFLITEIVLGMIGAVALIVALIGIVNIMTISLLERTHEVGVMKAIGATNQDIRKIFEYEVIFFGFLGGAVGIGSAWLFGRILNSLVNYLVLASDINSKLTIFITPPIFALEMLAISILVSLFAGWYPAKRAAKLSPSEALRYE